MAMEEMNLLSSQRAKIQALKKDVFSAQILERILIRREHLESILDEELELGTRLSQVRDRQIQDPGTLGLETTLVQKLGELERQKREEDKLCWRDIGMVIPHLLNAVEALQAAQTRDSILNHTGYVQQYQPQTSQSLPSMLPQQVVQSMGNHYVQEYQRRTP